MKISKETVGVLHNFAVINHAIVINSGDVLETISTSKTIKAKAKVDTTFPKKFALYDLNKFNNTLNMYNDPDIDFGENSVTISEGNDKSTITYSDESTIVTPPDKEIKLPCIDASVTITLENLNSVMKAMAVLGLPEVHITGDGKNIYLQGADSKNPSGDVHSITIGSTNKTFRAILNFANIRVIPSEYTVEICSKGVSRWFNDKLEYFIAVESSSTF